MGENGVFLTGTVTKIEGLQVYEPDSVRMLIGQLVTVSITIPYVGKNYSDTTRTENKNHTVDVPLFYAGGVLPPRIGTEMNITAQDTTLIPDRAFEEIEELSNATD